MATSPSAAGAAPASPALNEAEELLLLYFREWIARGGEITPEVAAGFEIKLWGDAKSARAEFIRAPHLRDPYFHRIRMLLDEAAEEEP
jgi:hypothetical protein